MKKVVKTGAKYLVYPPKEYQEKLKKLDEKKVKVIVIEESNKDNERPYRVSYGYFIDCHNYI